MDIRSYKLVTARLKAGFGKTRIRSTTRKLRNDMGNKVDTRIWTGFNLTGPEGQKLRSRGEELAKHDVTL